MNTVWSTERALLSLAKRRGYEEAFVLACVVDKRGSEWLVDKDHPAFPHPRGITVVDDRKDATCKAGSALKQILGGWPFRITATGTCPCLAYAAQMDGWGCDECERRIEEIVAHLREQAFARGLPFLDAAGRLLVRRAIKNARKSLIDP